MKKIVLNELFSSGSFRSGLKAGLMKPAVEKQLGKSLEGSYLISTPDVDYYVVEMETDANLTVIFDKARRCDVVKISMKENLDRTLVIQLGEQEEVIDKNTSFDRLIEILLALNIEWEFDRAKVFLQVVCIRFKNGLRLFYAFGNKSENDHGLFEISSNLEIV
ncbi:hypothetical protein F0L74_15145 [Chitinophaga agrisoli]|uniref:Uncharacterized protein n=1 Tax=Chitinophaga agrisoli TaxID=2607653 RepID=A0A5B2W0M1_9BACT|nr:hypothetical protein [Chitinophaga agrisoli]KAA2243809.1 hypothetical protein F0L74_15145 [Chitinophaga agrisoli]